MNDFEDRLTAVLTGEADGAPHSAGLAQAARRRRVVRRRRRVVVGGTAAALLIAAPVAVLAGRGDGDDQAGDDHTAASTTWQTVAQGDVRAEIPGDWAKFTCDFDGFTSDVYGPTDEDACDFGQYLAFYASATFDPSTGPGFITPSTEDGPAWAGYVYAGDRAVSSSTSSAELTRRILATARVESDPHVDVSEWRTVEGVGIQLMVPQSATLGPRADDPDFYVCVLPGGGDDRPEPERPRHPADYYTGVSFVAGRWVSVAAPTQALRDLVTTEVVPADQGDHERSIGCVAGGPG